MIEFPVLSKNMATEPFRPSREDPAHRGKTEGGYTYTRPKHTRRPRRFFTIGFRFITQDDMNLLDEFWDTVRGGSLEFLLEHPITKQKMVCRFAEGETMAPTYVGVGGVHLWDIDLKVEET